MNRNKTNLKKNHSPDNWESDSRKTWNSIAIVGTYIWYIMTVTLAIFLFTDVNSVKVAVVWTPYTIALGLFRNKILGYLFYKSKMPDS